MSNTPGMTPGAPGKKSRRPPRRLRRALIAAVLMVAGSGALHWELETSSLQSLWLSRFAAGVSHSVAEGPNSRLRFPAAGPFDARLGYTRIPDFQARLESHGYEVAAQARVSPGYQVALDYGLFPIYEEKSHAGLQIFDRGGRPIYARTYPGHVFPDIDAIPRVIVDALLFIENHRLLDADAQYQNVAFDWRRTGAAAVRYGRRALGAEVPVHGASTLATQIEKFRHSPGGITPAPGDKLRQMMSAALRAYRQGRDTRSAREQIVVDYINGVPLSAVPRHGEVHGLLDALWAWYGIEADAVEVLHEPLAELIRAARVYRAALSLVVAGRAPSFYLATERGRVALADLTDSYLRLLEANGMVPAALAQAARAIELDISPGTQAPGPESFVEQKAASAIRTTLLSLLGTASLYELDRYDLSVHSSIDWTAQRGVVKELQQLADPAQRVAAGLTGERMLPAGPAGGIVYSVLLYEATAYGNLLRVQADSFNGPFDVNRHTRLELGSTAKLRALVSYLETADALYRQLVDESDPQARDAFRRDYTDPLSRWAARLLSTRPDLSLEEFLAAAMQRRYPANPHETFFTGGGIHRFSNFDRTHDARSLTVQEAFAHSVNLVFIRLMRDVVAYQVQRLPNARAALQDRGHPARRHYLERFADHEGQQFLTRFYARHAGRSPLESIDMLLSPRTVSPARYARVYRAVCPAAGVEALAVSIRTVLGASEIDGAAIARLYTEGAPERYDLADLGWITGLHPLELWLVRYLWENPHATFAQAVGASEDARLQAYGWLFRTKVRAAQDRRIRTVLEMDAFTASHRQWQRHGYPFAKLVPSYATSIGSSGDNPLALAELVGLLVNDGIRRPLAAIEALDFAVETPFETRLQRRSDAGERVLSSEVARIARNALQGVVESGTGRRMRGVLHGADGVALPLGGKTGTGNNRIHVTNSDGHSTAVRALNRTATFAFFGGPYFGVITVYVAGEASAQHEFTSSVATQLLRHLEPVLAQLISTPADCGETSYATRGESGEGEEGIGPVVETRAGHEI